MQERSVRGQQQHGTAACTEESAAFTVDDRLAAITPAVPLRVQSLPPLRIPGPIRCARGLFADFTRMERAPSTPCETFSVRVGFALMRRLPSHEIRLSPRSRPAPSVR
jgi:hypothetical protein